MEEFRPEGYSVTVAAFFLGITSQGELKFEKDQELAVFFQRETRADKTRFNQHGAKPKARLSELCWVFRSGLGMLSDFGRKWRCF